MRTICAMECPRARNQAEGHFGDDEAFVSVGEVLSVLWRKSWLLLAAAVAAGGLALVATQLVTPEYDAEAIVSAVPDDSSASRLSSLSSLVSQFGGLAAAAGIPTTSARTSEWLQILQSRSLTERFIQNNGLLPVLFAEQWDKIQHRWKTDATHRAPTLWEGNLFFSQHVRRLATDTKTSLSTLTIRWKDPQVAARWANQLVVMADNEIRDAEVDEAQRSVSYLQEQLGKSTLVSLQTAISTLLEAEVKRIMLARVSKNYALRVVDAAEPPDRPSSPQRVVWTLLGAGFGVAVSAIWILMRAGRSHRPAERRNTSRAVQSEVVVP